MRNIESLKSRMDFKNVYENGISFANRYLVMYVLRNELSKNRIGISVSKKVGNSVVRHHITRLVRESYRLNEDLFEKGFDIIIIGRINSKNAKYINIEESILYLAGLHNIKKNEMI